MVEYSVVQVQMLLPGKKRVNKKGSTADTGSTTRTYFYNSGLLLFLKKWFQDYMPYRRAWGADRELHSVRREPTPGIHAGYSVRLRLEQFMQLTE